jgi:chorismate dehydratase
MLRVGKIDYINADPLFAELPDGEVELVPAVPSALNAMLREGRLDVSAISAIEYARAAEQYLLVPGAGISASGAIRSVLLLAPAPLEQLAGQTFYLSTGSATTVALLKILLARQYRIVARFERWDLAAGLPAGPVMLIGDPALTVPPQRTHPLVIDLCAEWVRMTGLPMTFALICARRAAAAADPAAVARLARAFRENARRWPATMDRVLDPAAAQVAMPREEVRAYLLGLEFRLEPRHLDGLRLFYELAAGVGELATVPALEFLPASD